MFLASYRAVLAVAHASASVENLYYDFVQVVNRVPKGSSQRQQAARGRIER